MTTSSTWPAMLPPRSGLEQLVIYEVHTKGFTAHQSSGVRSPGTYLGFIEKIPHLRRWASTPSNCCRCTSTTSTIPAAAGPDQLLGLQLDRILRARIVVLDGPGPRLPG